MKPHQKEMIQNFRDFTNCKPDTAQNFLKKANWDFNNAINNYFEQGYEEPILNTSDVFNKYKNIEGKIDAQNIVRFFQDIGVLPTDPLCGYFMYLMQAKDTSEIQIEEFSKFCQHINSNTLDQVRASVPNLRAQFKDAKIFKQVYNYLFQLYKDNPKFLKLEVAMTLWQLYLQGRYHYYHQFLKFMEDYNKPVSRDIWKMVLQFQIQTKGDLKNYRQQDGWPVIIDNFVKKLQNKQ